MRRTCDLMGLAMSGFHHEAVFYASDEEYLAGLLPDLRTAIDLDGAILVAVGDDKVELLRGALGADADRVRFTDMERLGRNPACIIPAWREFMATRGQRPAARDRRAGLARAHRRRADRVPPPRVAAQPRLRRRRAVAPAVPVRRPRAPAGRARRRPPQPPAREPRRRQRAVRRLPRAADRAGLGRAAPEPGSRPGRADLHARRPRARAHVRRRARRRGGPPRGPAVRPRAGRQRAGHQLDAPRRRPRPAERVARERHAPVRGPRPRPHHRPAGRARAARPTCAAAGAGSGSSTTCAIWCRCAPRRRAT